VGTVAISDPEGSTGLDSPKRLSCPPPSYPQMLLEAGVGGVVRAAAAAVVGTDGRVEPGSVEILSSTNRAFEAPVRYMIQNCTFDAGRMNGVRVETAVRFAVPVEVRWSTRWSTRR
jgi:outer membrane biosynthesis protein TonB